MLHVTPPMPVRPAVKGALMTLGVLAMLLLASAPGHAQVDNRAVANALVVQFVADADVQALKGKTLVITRFANRGDDEQVDPVALQDALTNAFIQAKLFRVIERERLGKALEELKLDATSGLIDPDTQKALGKFLGADFIVTGLIAGTAGRITVGARLARIETMENISAAAYPPPGEGRGGNAGAPPPIGSQITLVSWNASEFEVTSDATSPTAAKSDAVRWLVEQGVLREAQDVHQRWLPEITRAIYDNPDRYLLSITARRDAYYLKLNFTQVSRDLVSIIFGKITPRIAVDTTEVVIRRPVPDPAVQAVLEGALLKDGFQVVDSNRAKMALLREAILQAGTGDARAADLVRTHAGELAADIAAVGESFAEERSTQDGFDARVEFKLVDQATGRVFSSISSRASVTRRSHPQIDPSSGVAAMLALELAAKEATVRMVADILKSYGQPVFRVRVWNITSFAQRTAIIDGLKAQLPGATVAAISLDLRQTKCAVFEIMTKRGADQIAEALEKLPGLRVSVTGIECRSLVCTIQK